MRRFIQNLIFTVIPLPVLWSYEFWINDGRWFDVATSEICWAEALEGKDVAQFNSLMKDHFYVVWINTDLNAGLDFWVNFVFDRDKVADHVLKYYYRVYRLGSLDKKLTVPEGKHICSIWCATYYKHENSKTAVSIVHFVIILTLSSDRVIIHNFQVNISLCFVCPH